MNIEYCYAVRYPPERPVRLPHHPLTDISHVELFATQLSH